MADGDFLIRHRCAFIGHRPAGGLASHEAESRAAMTSFAEIAFRPSREGWICDTPATLDNAFERWLVAAREANRIADVLIRWNLRFRVWERGCSERATMHARALVERRRDAIRIAEYAARELGPLWDQYSRLLGPLTEAGKTWVACYIGPAGSAIAAWPMLYGCWAGA